MNKKQANKQRSQGYKAQKEKIVYDFLLQATFSLLASILLYYIYNARLFSYGNNIGLAVPTFIWTVFGISTVVGAICICLWKFLDKNVFKICAIYAFITAAGMFWCIGLEEVIFALFARTRFTAKALMELLFVIIAISIPVELIIYSIRKSHIGKG